MKQRNAKRVATVGVALTLATLTAACGGSSNEGSAPEDTTPVETTVGESTSVADGPDTGAAELRATLTGLLSEHVYLAALATGAALRGDTPGFTAFATALNGPSNSNTSDLVAGITSVYGAEVGKAFDGLWRSEGHIPAVVAYTQAVAKKDTAGATKAVNDLLAYAKTFGTTLNSVNENLPAAAVEEGVKMHATTLKAVIDAQAAKDATLTATTLRAATKHMDDLADAIAGASVKKFPEKF